MIYLNLLRTRFLKKSKFLKVIKKQLLLAIVIIGGFMPEVYATSTLEGTPQIQSGATVYTAIVEPNQTYTSVFGVRGGNTDYSGYGKVIINQGTVTGTVYGARALSGDELTRASCNIVDIDGSNVGTVYGGYAYGGSNNASVHSNKVTINNSNITGYVYGGNADGSTISVTGNEVVINQSQISKTVYGGCAFNTSSWLSMLRNKVVIENSIVNGSVYGGYASGSATASNSNTVIIKADSYIKGSVYGGYALSNNSDAKNNTVIIEGGTVDGHIYGGVGRNASGNTIVVKGGNLTNADLYGYSDGRKSHSENTLELWAADTKIKSVRNFENYFFLIPNDIANQEDIYMLRLDEPVNLSGVNVGITVQNGTQLHINDKVNLIDKVEGMPTLIDLDGKTVKGGTLLTKYDFYLSSTDGTLTAIATSEGSPLLLQSSPDVHAGKTYAEAKSVTEGQVTSVALLGKGSELAMSLDLSDVKTALHTASADGKTLATFFKMDYGKTDYYTDSHIRIKNTGIIAGIAKEFSGFNTDNLLGLFFEFGHGNYSTFNSFESGSVYGNGNANYYGGGLLFQLQPLKMKGLYFQALARLGGIDNSWSTDDFFREKVSYNTHHLYYGTATGAGYQNKIGKKICYDVYGKFMWTHQNGDNANVKGEKVQFQNINSLKTGIGLKVSFDGWKVLKPFIRITWEREFNAVADAKVNNLKVDAADLKGNSGIFELGITCKPESKANWQLDLAATGYIGVRKEFRGSAFFNWNF